MLKNKYFYLAFTMFVILLVASLRTPPSTPRTSMEEKSTEQADASSKIHRTTEAPGVPTGQTPIPNNTDPSKRYAHAQVTPGFQVAPASPSVTPQPKIASNEATATPKPEIQPKKETAPSNTNQQPSVQAANPAPSSRRDTAEAQIASRGKTLPKENPVLMPWFGKAENVFSIGTVATIMDVNTGIRFKVKRTYGYNHADVETVSKEDTEILKELSGGDWSWTRRAVIVEVNGQRIAASIAPMPHAGREDQPANITVSNRSCGYGTGANLDAVKGNDLSGVIDIHFLHSRTHSTNSVNAEHQEMVMKAFRSGR